MDMRFLPTKIHGLIDYIVGVLLIFSPSIFGFQNIGGASVVIPVILGSGLILFSLLTEYEWSLFKLIPMRYHLILDSVGAVLIIIAPFVFSFIYQELTVWLPNVLMGIALIVVSLFSETTAYHTTEVQ